jgi:hypothetical protein
VQNLENKVLLILDIFPGVDSYGVESYGVSNLSLLIPLPIVGTP